MTEVVRERVRMPTVDPTHTPRVRQFTKVLIDLMKGKKRLKEGAGATHGALPRRAAAMLLLLPLGALLTAPRAPWVAQEEADAADAARVAAMEAAAAAAKAAREEAERRALDPAAWTRLQSHADHEANKQAAFWERQEKWPEWAPTAAHTTVHSPHTVHLASLGVDCGPGVHRARVPPTGGPSPSTRTRPSARGRQGHTWCTPTPCTFPSVHC